MRRTETEPGRRIRPGGGWSRAHRLSAWLLILALPLAAAACGDDDDGPSGPTRDLTEVAGLYEVLTITFDPRGSAPASDILAVLAEAGTQPTLNVGLTGDFQLFYRDPVSGNVLTISGRVEPVTEGIELVFPTQAVADQFLFPRRLPLQYDEVAETLSFSGETQVSRARLLNLFPDVYAEEQLFDPTPGILTVGFEKADESS